MAKNKYSILFENDDYVIINKPAGLLVIPDRYDALKPCLIKMLNERYEEVYVVHRIDMETSGVICFALNEVAHKHASMLFEENNVDKTYMALCSSIPFPENGSINTPIKASESVKGKMITHPKGKVAETHYELIEKLGSFSLLKVKIKTGRTHQIRVHLSSISCPLIVDKKYGNSEAFFLSHIKGRKYNRKKDIAERPLMARHSLHSSKISFTDAHGKEIFAEAEYPKDFKAVMNQLRKLN